MKFLPMKYILSILILFYTINIASSQIAGIIPNNPNDETVFDCAFCFSNNVNYRTGVKFGFGYGVYRELNPLLDLTANLSFNYWRYEVFTTDQYGIEEYTYDEDNAYFAISVGERINFLKFKESHLFTGVNINSQFYINGPTKFFGLGIEPNIGWRRKVGKRHEIFSFVGYDQHLISYNKLLPRQPNKVSLMLGFNLNLQKEEATVIE